MGRRAPVKAGLDTELAELPAELRWREWMARVEAVIFAAPEPVPRQVLAKVVGRDCNLDLLIDAIGDELRGRPYELVSVAGGWQHRTRTGFADAIRAATGLGAAEPKPLSQSESLILMGIAYFQPITRGELGRVFGKEISRDVIGQLRALGFIAAGPRSPTPGAPYTNVTTKTFLSHFGFESLRDLPDIERLEDAGLLSKDRLLADSLPVGFLDGLGPDAPAVDGDDEPFERDEPLAV
jgi:chromosome segregation and condensation protein ScpB